MPVVVGGGSNKVVVGGSSTSGVTYNALDERIDELEGDNTDITDTPDSIEPFETGDDLLIIQNGLLYKLDASGVLSRANHTGTMPYTALGQAPRQQSRHSQNQSIPNNLWTTVGFDTQDAAVGGLGTLSSVSTTVAAGSNGQTLPFGTINVASTTGFPGSGALLINGPSTAGANVFVAYSGTTSTSFTGCTLGTGTLATSQVVKPANHIITLPEAGMYIISATATFASNATGRRGIKFLVSSVLPIGTVEVNNTSSVQSVTTCLTYTGAAASTLQLQVFQNSGGVLSSNTDNLNAPRVNIDWIRPV